jgi:hypothetical protein|tara:strand:- start:543 stop:743 length:201 start_codon:yes stop_codon:yes gene_type:complete
MAKRYLTKKQLTAETSAPGYTIDYLRDCKRLPIVYESRGQGYPTLYHPDAVKVVKDHLQKGQDRSV